MSDKLKVHNELDLEDLFKDFSKEIIFLFKTIKNLPIKAPFDYDKYIEILKNSVKKIKASKNLNELAFDRKILLKKMYEIYNKLKIEKEE